MSRNKITEDYLLISDGSIEGGKWKPVVPDGGSIYYEIKKTVEKALNQVGDRVWLKGFCSEGNYVKLAEVR